MAKNVSAGVKPAEERARGRSVWVDPELYEQLCLVARHQRRSASAQACFMLHDYMARTTDLAVALEVRK